MIGGRVQQVIRRDEHDLVEVLDPSYFDRQWRMVPHGTVAEGDHLWWQSFVGYINDEAIGFCRPAAFEERLPRWWNPIGSLLAGIRFARGRRGSR